MSNDTFLTADIPNLSNPNYLGDFKVVGRLLRSFASDVMKKEFAAGEEAGAYGERSALGLARIFLGQDPHYPGPLWNSPGQIDLYLGERCGTDSTDPEELVAGALLDMLSRLLGLAAKINQGTLATEQWQQQVDGIVQEYTNLFMGLPREGLEPPVSTGPEAQGVSMDRGDRPDEKMKGRANGLDGCRNR